MSAKLHITAGLAVAAIFGAGFLVGRWAEVRWATATGAASPAVPVEERWLGTTLDEYQRRLRLTPAQVEAIRPLIQEASQKMTGMRRELKADLHAAVKKMNERVSNELTVEQRREFVTLIREKQAQRDAAGK